MITAFLAVILLTGTDQFIKFWAVENLKGHESKKFIGFGDTDILNLTYLENDGAMFGSFGGLRWILVSVTFILMIFCVYYLIKHKSEKAVVVSMTLIVSGGIGNIIDRIFRGGLVVDYLDVQLFDFAVFNFADCCVTIGAVLLLIYIIFFDKGSTIKKAESGETSNE